MLSKIEKVVSSVGLTVGGVVIVFGSVTAVRLVSEINTLHAETAAVEQMCQAAEEARASAKLAKAPASAPATSTAPAVANSSESNPTGALTP